MATRPVQALTAVAVLIGLAACGSVTAGSAGHPASASASPSRPAAAATGTPAAATGTPTGGGALCADGQGANGQGADRVVVSRTAASRRVTLSGAPQVRAMVAALCALPVMSPGQHCPAASAGSVQLVFASGTRSFPPVSVQESGCRSVTGIGATRSWSASSSFGQMLDEAVGGFGRLVPGTHPSSVPTAP